MMTCMIRKKKKWMTAINKKMKDYKMLLMPINNKRIISRIWIKRKKKSKNKSKKKVKNKKTIVHPQSKNNFLKKHNRQFNLHSKQMMIIRSNKVTVMTILMKIVMSMIRKKRVEIKTITQRAKNKKINMKLTYLIDNY